jgi:YgiT-type zinc finger domain-containing protein
MISYTQPYEGRLYIVENVPADVCRQCGEIVLDPSTAKKIQKLVWSSQPKGTLQLPVFDLAEVS